MTGSKHRDVKKAAQTALHTIEAHNAKELRRDVKGVLDHLTDWLAPRAQAFTTWYLAQPLYWQIIYGLTVVPVAVLLAFMLLLLIKLGAPLLLALALLLKLLLSLTKTLLFIGYIAYKILKTLILWYYTISRLYLGHRAKRQRMAMARAGRFAVEPVPALDQLAFRCQGKNLYILHTEAGQLRVLFSYLRYALLGQQELLKHLQRSWKHYILVLLAWRQASRAAITTELAAVSAFLFSPHTLGAHITAERVLVPGDAELLSIQLGHPAGDATLAFRIRWTEWRFKFRRTLKFLLIKRQQQENTWTVNTRWRSSL
jgi:hypothetical protein